MRAAAKIGAQWCAVGLGFSIPVSVALDNVLLLAFIAFWLSSGELSARLRRVAENPVAMMGLAFAVAILLGMTWSTASTEQLREALGDALRFALLGLFAFVFL